jgi:hypothetical protein
MKKNLDLLTKLHYELNLDNFFTAEIYSHKVNLLGWHTPELEKLLFDKGYQVEFKASHNQYVYDELLCKITLAVK